MGRMIAVLPKIAFGVSAQYDVQHGEGRCQASPHLSRFLELNYAQVFGFDFLHIGGNKGRYQGGGELRVAQLPISC